MGVKSLNMRPLAVVLPAEWYFAYTAAKMSPWRTRMHWVGDVVPVRTTYLEDPDVSRDTDLYSLYKYLVKLSTTKEKRLIINIMALCQLYKCKKSQRFNGLMEKITLLTL